MKMKKTASTTIALLRVSSLALCALFASRTASLSAIMADGNDWVNSGFAGTIQFDSVSVVNSNFVVAGSGGAGGGQVFLYQNGAWNPFPGWTAYKEGNTPFGAWANSIRMYVYAASESEVWIGSGATSGNYLRWDGTNFNTHAYGSSQTGLRVAGFNRANGSTVMFGMLSTSVVSTARSTVGNPTPTISTIDVNGAAANHNITGVSGYDETNMWAVGSNYLYRSANHGNSYTQYSQPGYAAGNMSAVFALDAGNTIAATTSGDVFLWNITTGFASSLMYDFNFDITAIYATDLNNIWVAGGNGNFWYYDGTDAFKIDLGMTSGQYLRSISGTGSDNIWVAGDNGQIWHTVPEPSALLLCALALTGFVFARGPQKTGSIKGGRHGHPVARKFQAN